MKPALGVSVVVALFGVSIGSAYALAYWRAESGQVSADLVSGPETWVPFSARVRSVNENGQVRVGKFYRSSDGSLRNEMGPRVGEVTIITINSIKDHLSYAWRSQTGWESHPMEMPPGEYKPRITRRPIALGTVLPSHIEGFDILKERADRNGITNYYAPDLNFHPVRIELRCRVPISEDCGISLSEIILGEQPGEYFRPIYGQPIVARNEPAGITRGARPAVGGQRAVCAPRPN
jgi:hypothetical protein